jgi:hypothetical protein
VDRRVRQDPGGREGAGAGSLQRLPQGSKHPDWEDIESVVEFIGGPYLPSIVGLYRLNPNSYR